MTNKVLKASAVIPKDLYVMRDADRQLKNIIDDMGRPGYVLVARQMGKTNMLLHAKREYQTESSVYVYIDLSNPFESAKDCFRNIIDTAIETITSFSNVKNILHKNREKNFSGDHREHLQELRTLAQCITGKLVIFLDEVDALTKASYSDQIFSLIRSIYFSGRENFPELKKVTYVLSGVAEPTELIKDPKISPFNIGQKIYLDDFTYDEFLSFISKSQLKLNNEVVNRIFYWTNGNPRMTWDLCSDIEDSSFKNLHIDVEFVDQLVKMNYLTKFDRVPIDNIRQLVELDNQVRNAIVVIKYGRGNSLSDEIKTRLYLAGIISSDFHTSNLTFKNKIIENSLSDEWINSINRKKENLVKQANQLYDELNYADALNYFEQALQENIIGNYYKDPTLNIRNYFRMGYCAFKVERYDKSINYFELTKWDKKLYPDNYYRTKNLLAMAYLELKEYDKSEVAFNEVINAGKKDFDYFDALLNKAIIYINKNAKQYQKEIEAIYLQILEEVEENKNTLIEDQYLSLKILSLNYLGNAYGKQSDIKKAKYYFNQALEISTPEKKIGILLNEYEILTNSNERKELIQDIVDKLMSHSNTDIIRNSTDEPLQFNEVLLKKILLYSFIESEQLFDVALKQANNLIFSKSEGTLLLETAILGLIKLNYEPAKSLLLLLTENQEKYKLSINELYKCYKYLLYFTKTADINGYFDSYVKYLFKDEIYKSFDQVDFNAFYKIFIINYSSANYKDLQKNLSLINKTYNYINEDLKIDFIIVRYWEMRLANALKNNRLEVEKAKEILLLINHYKSLELINPLQDKEIEYIKNQAEASLSYMEKRIPIRKEKQYERNQFLLVRYTNGDEFIRKYKIVMDDIDKGLCIVVNENISKN